MKDISFKAYAALSPVDKEDHVVDFTITVDDDKDECSLTIDEVEYAADEAVEAAYPLEFYPKREVKHTLIMIDGSGYPVIALEDTERTKEELKVLTDRFGVDRCLELPYAVYTLTDEYRLYSQLLEEGLLFEDDDFDYEQMHRILEKISDKNKKNHKEA